MPRLDPVDPPRRRYAVRVRKITAEHREVRIQGARPRIHVIQPAPLVHHVAARHEPKRPAQLGRHRAKPGTPPALIRRFPREDKLVFGVRLQCREMDSPHAKHRRVHLVPRSRRAQPLAVSTDPIPHVRRPLLVQVDPVDRHRGCRIRLPCQVHADRVRGLRPDRPQHRQCQPKTDKPPPPRSNPLKRLFHDPIQRTVATRAIPDRRHEEVLASVIGLESRQKPELTAKGAKGREGSEQVKQPREPLFGSVRCGRGHAALFRSPPPEGRRHRRRYATLVANLSWN